MEGVEGDGLLVGIRLAGRQARRAGENRGVGGGLQLGAGVEPAAEIDGGGGDHRERDGGKRRDDGDVAADIASRTGAGVDKLQIAAVFSSGCSTVTGYYKSQT